MSTKGQTPTALDVPACSVIYCVAVLLKRPAYNGIELTQTMSWRSGCTEDEARGAAVAYAFEQKPGFSIDMVTVAKIELPSPNTEIGQPRRTDTR
jgi:hypothetical protein